MRRCACVANVCVRAHRICRSLSRRCWKRCSTTLRRSRPCTTSRPRRSSAPHAWASTTASRQCAAAHTASPGLMARPGRLWRQTDTASVWLNRVRAGTGPAPATSAPGLSTDGAGLVSRSGGRRGRRGRVHVVGGRSQRLCLRQRTAVGVASSAVGHGRLGLRPARRSRPRRRVPCLKPSCRALQGGAAAHAHIT